MALTGTYLRTLDDKKRVAVPKRLRDDFGDTELNCLMIAPGTERSLVVYSIPGFELFAAKLKAEGNHQKYLRLFYSAAERVELVARPVDTGEGPCEGEVTLSTSATVDGAKVELAGKTPCDVDGRFLVRLAQPGTWTINGATVEISDEAVLTGVAAAPAPDPSP